MKKILTIILFLLPLTAFSQERIFKFLLVYQGTEEVKLRPSLESALLKAIPHLQLVNAEGQKEEKELSFLAQRWSCDVILTVETQPQDAKLSVQWALKTVQEKQTLVQGSFARELGTWANQAEIFWIPLSTRLEEFLSQKGETVPKAVEASVSHVVIKAIPGTVVSGMNGGPLPVNNEGVLEIELTFPASYTFQGSHQAYRTKAYSLFLLTSTVEITLQQQPEKVWTGEVGLLGGSFPYLLASWSPLPGKLFLRTGIQQYFFGLNLNTFRIEDESTASMVVSLPLFHVNLGAGWYFNSPESLVRYYLSLDFFGRFMTPDALILEPVAPWGARPQLGLEYRPSDVFGLFLETGPQFFLLNNSQVFLSSRSREGIPIFDIAEGAVGMEPLVFQVGARFYF